ncbi:chemotaxis protein CheW [Undibacterium sp.]|jgi:chemotaxis signal transduction protein|uniref:chemotaxis protein CheW n=1 Tax=Undibacterium sp. TaxID=1914977 RepID=UPI002D054737|nr:chemotaxis protein CheW [Undibacterium sp.]HTD02583.1 chemotaxis protein CheW [Undibacterium sp.]
MNTAATTTASNAFLASEQALRDLREEFDLAFSLEPIGNGGEAENFLVLKIAGDAYALSVSQISGLYAGRGITLLPSPLPELIGLAGFRAQVTPVYDLAALLGYPPATTSKWIIVLRHESPVAVAFEEFHSHLSIAPERITASGFARPQHSNIASHLRDAIRAGGAIFPIIDVQSILNDIQQRVDATRSIKER